MYLVGLAPWSLQGFSRGFPLHPPSPSQPLATHLRLATGGAINQLSQKRGYHLSSPGDSLTIFPKILWFLPQPNALQQLDFFFFFDNPLSYFGGTGSFCREPPLLLGSLLITNRESLVWEVTLSQAWWREPGAGGFKVQFPVPFSFPAGGCGEQ